MSTWKRDERTPEDIAEERYPKSKYWVGGDRYIWAEDMRGGHASAIREQVQPRDELIQELVGTIDYLVNGGFSPISGCDNPIDAGRIMLSKARDHNFKP